MIGTTTHQSWLFSQVIRKGKAQKPNEFGRLVRLDEVEQGIVSGYHVLEGNAADTTSCVPALDHHHACLGPAPPMATADRGFFSAQHEREAEARGVAKVALPARGRLSRTRAARQKQRWFRRAMRWRAAVKRRSAPLLNAFVQKCQGCTANSVLSRGPASRAFAVLNCQVLN